LKGVSKQQCQRNVEMNYELSGCTKGRHEGFGELKLPWERW